MIWLVILIIFGVMDDTGQIIVYEKKYVVDRQITEELCEEKVKSVWADMRDAYPGDKTYAMQCECRTPEDKPCPMTTQD